MKVLSDNTARRLTDLLASQRGGNPAPRPRRGAATVPPARLWQLHVTGSRVTVDRGFYLSHGAWAEFEAAEIGEASDGALAVAELDGDTLEVSLKTADDLQDAEHPYRVLGRVHANAIETGYYVEQFESGPIYFDEPGAHWGETEPLAEIPADGPGAWNAMIEAGADGEPTAVAESRLVDIDLDDDGRVTAKHYRTVTIDSKGNVVAISERTENDPAPDPGEPDDGGDTPHCGHPLNEDPDDDHPLDGGGGGGGENGRDDDDHPLDHEGPGGFTPKCAD